MAEDSFRDDHAGLDKPAQNAMPVTPSDSTVFDKVTRAIHVGTAGNVHLDMMGNGEQTLALSVGWHPLRCTRIYSTSTTASGISIAW